MKILPFLILLFLSFTGFSQSKEDVVDCMNLIFGQDEFRIAYSNDLTPNGAIVITSDGKRRLRDNNLNKIRSSLTQDDFYDFDHPIKVVVSSHEDLETLGISSLYVLNFFIGGNENKLNFSLDTIIKNENLQYTWNYNLIKENGEWEIVGRSVRSNRY